MSIATQNWVLDTISCTYDKTVIDEAGITTTERANLVFKTIGYQEGTIEKQGISPTQEKACYALADRLNKYHGLLQKADITLGERKEAEKNIVKAYAIFSETCPYFVLNNWCVKIMDKRFH